jgi:hypothetical protein
MGAHLPRAEARSFTGGELMPLKTSKRLASLAIAALVVCVAYVSSWFDAFTISLPDWVPAAAAEWHASWLIFAVAAFTQAWLWPAAFNATMNARDVLKTKRALAERATAGAYVLLVPGTFDAKPADKGQKLRWWEYGGDFQNTLRAHPFSNPGRLRVAHFSWSGDNSEAARDSAADLLADELRVLRAANWTVFVVAHSHGANVVRMAIRRLQARDLPRCVFAVGAPFFVYNRRAQLERLSVGLVLSSVLVVTGVWLCYAALSRVALEMVPIAAALSSFPVTVGSVAMTLGGFGILGFIASTIAGARARKRLGHSLRWVLVHTELDEALSMLFRLSGPVFQTGAFDDFIKRHKFPRHPLARGSAICLVVIVVLQALSWALSSVEWAETPLVFMVLILVLSALLTTALAWGVSGILGEWILRGYRWLRFKWLQIQDKHIGAFVRSRTYGDDFGAGIVSVHSEPDEGTVVRPDIPQECIDELELLSAHAVRETWAKLRARLGQDRAARRITPLSDLKEAVSWQELDHTLYFKSAKFRAFLKDLIAAEIVESAALAPAEHIRRLQVQELARQAEVRKGRDGPWRRPTAPEPGV